jgi:hypothetical protein
MIIECQNCGAPLDVESGSSLARCKYCGKTQRVTRARTQLPHTPPNWQPPRQWTPPQHFPAQSVPLRYDASKKLARVILIVVVATTLAPILIMGGVFAAIAIVGARATSSSRSSPSPPSHAPHGPRSSPAPAPAPVSGSGVCAAAARCCQKVQPNNAACKGIVAVPREDTCKQVLDAMRDAAKAMGKTCD